MLTTGGTGEKAGCFVFHGFVLEWELCGRGDPSAGIHTPTPGVLQKEAGIATPLGKIIFPAIWRAGWPMLQAQGWRSNVGGGLSR